MREKIEKYLENFHKVISLDDVNDYHQYTKSELFQILYTNATIKQAISEENNRILFEVLKPLEEKKALTDVEREDVEYFFHRLKTGFESLDNGILYRLSKILLDDAILRDDLDHIVCYIYNFSYYEFVLQSMFPRAERDCSWEMVLQYEDRYDELSLEGKKYFLRCYGNQLLAKEYSYEKHKKIYNYIANKKKTYPNDPIPYDTFLFTIDKNICSGIEVIRTLEAQKKLVPQELLDGIYESASRVHNNLSRANQTSVPIRQVYEYTYHAIRFHRKELTIDEFLDCLKGLSLVEENYSIQEKASSIIKMNAYWIYYLNYKYDDAEEIKKQIDPTVKKVLKFIRSIKPSDYTRNMNSDVLSFLQTISHYYSFDELEDFYIRATTKRHTPTLIHTLSVAHISKMITTQMLEKNPTFFLGIVDDYDIAYINSHKNEIANLSYHIGLMHDIGKYFCIPIISINYRRLEDMEFKTIKQHPRYGYDLAKTVVPAPIRDGILYHHIWHNLHGGYPAGDETFANQPLVDVLSIADSIDAAVDFLGRSYAKRKTLRGLVEEFQSFKGTRYSKEVVELFDDEAFFQQVESFLEDGRLDIGYKAFCEEL